MEGKRFMAVIKNDQRCFVLFFFPGTYSVFWFLASIVERLLWKVVSANQRVFPNEYCVSIVGPRGNLENDNPVTSL